MRVPKKLFRVPLVANISASHKTLQNCDLLLIYLLLDHTNIYCDLFYSLHLLIGASSKFIWTLIKTNGGGVVRNITNHFRSDSLPSTKQVYKKCLQKVTTKSDYKKCPHLGPSRYSLIVQAHEWAKNKERAARCTFHEIFTWLLARYSLLSWFSD